MVLTPELLRFWNVHVVFGAVLVLLSALFIDAQVGAGLANMTPTITIGVISGVLGLLTGLVAVSLGQRDEVMA